MNSAEYAKLFKKRALSAFIRDFSVKELRDFADIFNDAIDVAEEMDRKNQAAEVERKAAIEALKQQMADQGIDISDLVSQKPKPRKNKYEWIDANGKTKKWAGVGAMPKSLKETMARDEVEIEYYLI